MVSSLVCKLIVDGVAARQGATLPLVETVRDVELEGLLIVTDCQAPDGDTALLETTVEYHISVSGASFLCLAGQ